MAAPDRLGLLAAVAGCLTLHRLDVVSADAATVDGDAAAGRSAGCSRAYGCAAGPGRAQPPTCAGRSPGDVSAIASGCAGRGRGSPERAARAAPGGLAPGRGHRRDLLELRAADAAGLLYRVARALDLAGAQCARPGSPRSARDVVDAFYLVGGWPTAEQRAAVDAPRVPRRAAPDRRPRVDARRQRVLRRR